MSRIKSNTEGFFSRGTSPKKESGSAIKVRDVTSTIQIDYKKLSEQKNEKCITNYCKCWICDSVKDFSIEYYNNTTILRDNDRSVHVPKVSK